MMRVGVNRTDEEKKRLKKSKENKNLMIPVSLKKMGKGRVISQCPVRCLDE